jgi:hypothetical protein
MALGLDAYQSIGFGTADVANRRSLGFHVEPCLSVLVVFSENILGAKSTILSVDA